MAIGLMLGWYLTYLGTHIVCLESLHDIVQCLGAVLLRYIFILPL